MFITRKNFDWVIYCTNFWKLLIAWRHVGFEINIHIIRSNLELNCWLYFTFSRSLFSKLFKWLSLVPSLFHPLNCLHKSFILFTWLRVKLNLKMSWIIIDSFYRSFWYIRFRIKFQLFFVFLVFNFISASVLSFLWLIVLVKFLVMISSTSILLFKFSFCFFRNFRFEGTIFNLFLNSFLSFWFNPSFVDRC